MNMEKSLLLLCLVDIHHVMLTEVYVSYIPCAIPNDPYTPNRTPVDVTVSLTLAEASLLHLLNQILVYD